MTKSIILFLSLGILSFNFKSEMSTIHDFKAIGIDGATVDFTSFKGKKLLIVNVASKCGYTPQYADLQKFHEMHGGKVAVLGFPANNFGSQEPGSNQEIQYFCEKNFGVTFQMFEKISVKGSDQHALYQWLKEKSGKEPSWNFCKYLVSEDGQSVEFFGPGVNPFDEAILGKL